MTPSPFDDVSVERLRRRRTVKWSLYGPDVLAAWVAEMDFDVAPAVKMALLDAGDPLSAPPEGGTVHVLSDFPSVTDRSEGWVHGHRRDGSLRAARRTSRGAR